MVVNGKQQAHSLSLSLSLSLFDFLDITSMQNGSSKHIGQELPATM
jgi:hypothetical protein